MKIQPLTFASKIAQFNQNLARTNLDLPPEVILLNPFKDPAVIELCDQFYQMYFSDNEKRTFLFGINPGRFGAGVTGITFTDPIRLAKDCGLPNDLDQRPELSSLFIYEMIEAFGGVKAFYSKFFLTAVCPLGFMRNGKNFNYYDDKLLQTIIEPFIIKSIKTQLEFGDISETAICLGEGKNFDFFQKLNAKHHFFSKIVPLAHPRFILQYRRKKKMDYISEYINIFSTI